MPACWGASGCFRRKDNSAGQRATISKVHETGHQARKLQKRHIRPSSRSGRAIEKRFEVRRAGSQRRAYDSATASKTISRRSRVTLFSPGKASEGGAREGSGSGKDLYVAGEVDGRVDVSLSLAHGDIAILIRSAGVMSPDGLRGQTLSQDLDKIEISIRWNGCGGLCLSKALGYDIDGGDEFGGVKGLQSRGPSYGDWLAKQTASKRGRGGATGHHFTFWNRLQTAALTRTPGSSCIGSTAYTRNHELIA